VATVDAACADVAGGRDEPTTCAVRLAKARASTCTFRQSAQIRALPNTAVPILDLLAEPWRFRAEMSQEPVVEVPRRTETSEAPGWQGATTKNIGNIRRRSNAARRDASPVECSGTPTAGS